VRKFITYPSIFVILAMAGCGGGDAPATDQSQEPAAEPEAPAVSDAQMAAENMELPEGVTPAMVGEGETIFSGAGLCHTCHMAGGTGGTLAPDLTDDEWINIDGSYDAIVNLVNTGVPEPKQHAGPMLPKGGSSISEDQVKAVAAYVWTLNKGS